MSTSKYAAIISSLPKLMGEDPAYQAKVEAVKLAKIDEDPVAMSSGSSLAMVYRQLREQKDQVESVLSDVNLELEAVSQLLVEQFAVEGTRIIHLVTGGSVGVQCEPKAVVKDKTALRRWALENGYEEALSLPWQTVNSVTKNLLLDGLPEPPGVEAYAMNKIVLRK